jgi:hypothetical protein
MGVPRVPALPTRLALVQQVPTTYSRTPIYVDKAIVGFPLPLGSPKPAPPSYASSSSGGSSSLAHFAPLVSSRLPPPQAHAVTIPTPKTSRPQPPPPVALTLAAFLGGNGHRPSVRFSRNVSALFAHARDASRDTRLHIVHGTVNDVPCRILIDSGCSHSLTSTAFARSAGLVVASLPPDAGLQARVAPRVQMGDGST